MRSLLVRPPQADWIRPTSNSSTEGTIQRQRWQRPSAVVGDRRSGRRNSAVGERRPRSLASRFGSFDLTAVTLNPPVANTLLWQNTSTGQVSVWELSGNTAGQAGPAADLGPSWQAVRTGDFDGDGRSPTSCGKRQRSRVSIWEMDGNTRTGGGSVANLGPSWQVAGTGAEAAMGSPTSCGRTREHGPSFDVGDGRKHPYRRRTCRQSQAQLAGCRNRRLRRRWEVRHPVAEHERSQVSMWEMDGNTHTEGPVSNLGPELERSGRDR